MKKSLWFSPTLSQFIGVLDDVLADRIIKALKEAPQITQKELVSMLDVPYRTLQRKMDELKVESRLEELEAQ